MKNNELTLPEAIIAALDEADFKQKHGKLFKADDDSPESQDFTNGDPETIYSITTMYEQFVNEVSEEKAHDEIIKALSEQYPNYI